ncbi:MAG: DNA repair protein RecO [Candidatus Magasanikbacteria bacterium]|nr:DNA repair protein RecO [Candidatus Magasanikbacteria bacterium]
MTINTAVIILKRLEFREDDLKIIFLSRDLGKSEAVAIGARKIGSKLAGHLEPWREVRMMLARGRVFDKIGQIKTLNNFCVQRHNEWQTRLAAQKATNLAEQLLPAGQRDERIYQLMKDFFHLQFTTGANCLFPIFGWLLISFLGFEPLLSGCGNCGRGEIKEPFFHFINGGLLCGRCAVREKKDTRQKITVPALAALKFFKKEKKLKPLNLPQNLINEIEDLFKKFLVFQVK